MIDIRKMELRFTAPMLRGVNQHWGSVMQGFLMTQLSPTYAAFLHTAQLRPYSQFVMFDKNTNELVWHISTLTKDASDEIGSALEDITSIYIKNKKLDLKLSERTLLCETSYEELMEQCLISPVDASHIQFQFMTSTTCKRDGQYALYPDEYLIMNSLYKRWNALAPHCSLESHIDLLSLVSSVRTNDYALRFLPFALERTRVPGYIGRYDLKLQGNDMCKHIAILLSQFANFSGVGIKTAIGMGGTLVTCMQSRR